MLSRLSVGCKVCLHIYLSFPMFSLGAYFSSARCVALPVPRLSLLLVRRSLCAACDGSPCVACPAFPAVSLCRALRRPTGPRTHTRTERARANSRSDQRPGRDKHEAHRAARHDTRHSEATERKRAHGGTRIILATQTTHSLALALSATRAHTLHSTRHSIEQHALLLHPHRRCACTRRTIHRAMHAHHASTTRQSRAIACAGRATMRHSD